MPNEPLVENGSPLRKNVNWKVFLASFLVALIAIYFLALRNYPYVITSPGPTWNVLGTSEDKSPLIDIKGAKTYQPTGTLLMTTVSSQGGPGSMVSGLDLLYAKMNSNYRIRPEADVYPPQATAKEIKNLNTQQMNSSQEIASAVALRAIGYKIPAVFRVTQLVENSPCKGKLEPGDTLISIAPHGGEPTQLNEKNVVFDFLDQRHGGDKVTIRFLRGQKEMSADITLMANPNGKGARMGVYIVPEMHMPLKVDFHLQDVGGPSAGTMFALGIVDQLTPGELTGGKPIAGTGALSLNGKVEPISGIAQKMAGAYRDGAKWFLAPSSNCDEVTGHIPAGLKVVSIDTFEHALHAVEDIAAGKTANLPTCPAK